MEQIGWIKLHKQLLQWEWYTDSVVKELFLHLLLKAKFKDESWKGVQIKRGQVLTGRVKLSQELALTQQQIRTALKKLKSTNEITIKTTNKFSLVTLVNYDSYQGKKDPSASKITDKALNEQPTTNQQLTTVLRSKEEKKKRRKEEEPLKLDLFEDMKNGIITPQQYFQVNTHPEIENDVQEIILKFKQTKNINRSISSNQITFLKEMMILNKISKSDILNGIEGAKLLKEKANDNFHFRNLDFKWIRNPDNLDKLLGFYDEYSPSTENNDKKIEETQNLLSEYEKKKQNVTKRSFKELTDKLKD